MSSAIKRFVSLFLVSLYVVIGTGFCIHYCGKTHSASLHTHIIENLSVESGSCCAHVEQITCCGDESNHSQRADHDCCDDQQLTVEEGFLVEQAKRFLGFQKIVTLLSSVTTYSIYDADLVAHSALWEFREPPTIAISLPALCIWRL